MFSVSKEDLERFGSYWIDVFELHFKGKNALNTLSQTLGFDRRFLKLILKKRNFTETKIVSSTLVSNDNAKIRQHNRFLALKYSVRENTSQFIIDALEEIGNGNKHNNDTVSKTQETSFPLPIEQDCIDKLFGENVEFIELLKSLVKMKQGDLRTFNKLLKGNKVLSLLAKLTFTALADKSVMNFDTLVLLLPILLHPEELNEFEISGNFDCSPESISKLYLGFNQTQKDQML
jgi:hypothetical protein